MILCFTIFFGVLSALSCFNFAFEALDQIEEDKVTLVIDKPSNVMNEDFLAQIDTALEMENADIMFRYIDMKGTKYHYQYYKTNHTTNFLNIATSTSSIQIGDSECISTTAPNGYEVRQLNTSSLMQDISFYPWKDAAQYDISAGTYYVKTEQLNAVTKAIRQLGYNVSVNPTNYISGQFSVLLFGFVPAFMLISSMAFYILSNGKKNVLKKMDGYTARNIIVEEVRDIFPAYSITFLAVVGITMVVVAILYKTAFFQFLLFFLPNIILLLAVLLVGIILSLFLIHRQKSAEYIKGRVPRLGIYITTIFAKGVFVAFIIFFLSIAIRNAVIAFNTIQTSHFISEKVSGYVTVPVNTNNTSASDLADNYKTFYSATVDRYNGILIDASNYEYSLIGGKTPAEKYGQTSITVNRNYLDFNPVYDMDGKQIGIDKLSNNTLNVLIPASKKEEKNIWQEFVRNAYSSDAYFITYDDNNSEIYSYNANTRTGNFGALDDPVILVVEEEQLEGSFILSYCSKGEYFIKVISDDPYMELLPILQETGIAPVTLHTPTVATTFSEAIRHQQQMLILYGTQSLLLLIGLFCLVLFSAKMYCENYKNKIAAHLIEGYSVLSCMKKHLIITAIYYAVVIVALHFISSSMYVSLNYVLLMVVFIGEIIITLSISQQFTQANLYQIVKGAE